MSMAGATIAASGLSALFSLSNAAAIAPPLSTSSDGKASRDFDDLSSGKNSIHATKHRRLSLATGQSKRRMGDAKDAMANPNATSLSSSSALGFISSLSLVSPDRPSTSSLHAPSHSHGHHTRTRSQAGKQNGVNGVSRSVSSTSVTSNDAFNFALPINIQSTGSNSSDLAQESVASIDDEVDVDVVEDDFDDGMSVVGVDAASEKRPDKKSTRVKKRGNIYKCESCFKVYRHPSCLIKHRWEHTLHWREASKFLLSKHQQVQLLEAATILSHLNPGSSLPEDRSLWPSFLSGGLLPPPSPANALPTGSATSTIGLRANSKSLTSNAVQPLSASVPSRFHTPSCNRSSSVSSGAGSGPRMHEYPVQGSVTRVRPGLLVHPNTDSSTSPGTSVSPYTSENMHDGMERPHSHNPINITSPSKPQPMNVPIIQDSTRKFETYREVDTYGISAESGSVTYSSGLSLPHSDLRSSSLTWSYSASRSGSRSDDDEEMLERSDVEDEVDVDYVDVKDGRSEYGLHRAAFDDHENYEARHLPYSFAARNSHVESSGSAVKKEYDDEWMATDMDI